MRKAGLFVLTAALMAGMMSGCSSETSNESNTKNESTESVEETQTQETLTAAEVVKQTDEDMFSERDFETSYNEDECVTIELKGDTATASSDSVTIKDNVITITEEAVYIINGELNDGMIVVNADENAKIQIVLNGVNINSESSAALYVLESDKVFVTLAEGSENTLSNGGTFTAIDDNNIDAAVFSKQDLTFNGSGTLTVTSPAGHGIVCKDDLVFTGGSYSITSASHGMDVNDSVRITDDVSIKMEAGKDGIHCENTDDTTLGYIYISGGKIDIKAEGDGISAGSTLQSDVAEITINAGGGSGNASNSSSEFYGGFMGAKPAEGTDSDSAEDESSTSMKGIKTDGSALISGGKITINSADDSIHIGNSITIDGGTFELASGDDAIHAELLLTVTDCDMNISTSYEGLEAKEIYVKGGNIVLNASDDGLNASGGTDASGTTGGRDGNFGGGMNGNFGGGKRNEMQGNMQGEMPENAQGEMPENAQGEKPENAQGEMPNNGNFGGGMHGGAMGGASDGVIEITGGNITIYASGDGLDANGTITISDGFIYVANPRSGDTSVIDSDISPVITGGTFISTGSTQMMAQSFDSTKSQGVIACTVGNQSAGSKVVIKDSEGNIVTEYDAEYSYVLIIVSTPEIEKGETYTVTIGDSEAEVTAK